MTHPRVLALLVVVFAGALAYLSDPQTAGQYAKRLLVITILLFSLMGLGAVFGKTLGDFLRNVNG